MPTPQAYATVQPAAGGAGTQVTVNGGGFPANTVVNAYLGVFAGPIDPNDIAISYASTLTDGNGNYSMSFVMPATEPDGTPLATGPISIVVATEDFAQQASTLFSYTAPTPTPTETPTDTPRDRPERPGRPDSIRDAIETRAADEAPAESEQPTATATAVETVASKAAPAGADASTTVTRRSASPTSTPTAAEALPEEREEPEPTATPTSAAPAERKATNTPLPTATNAPTNTPAAAAAPEPAPSTEQAVAQIRPAGGGTATRVVVSGSGFPANVALRIDVGFEGAPPAIIGHATTRSNARGNYRAAFAMPDEWPGGSSTIPTAVAVTVTTQDGSRQATALFQYRP
jgi:hypothetical protein